MPVKGDIAICSIGCIGLITCDEPQEVTYNDGNKGMAWVGIQLESRTIDGVAGDINKKFDIKVGSPWSSRNPKVIANINELAKRANLEDKNGESDS